MCAIRLILVTKNIVTGKVEAKSGIMKIFSALFLCSYILGFAVLMLLIFGLVEMIINQNIEISSGYALSFMFLLILCPIFEILFFSGFRKNRIL